MLVGEDGKGLCDGIEWDGLGFFEFVFEVVEGFFCLRVEL